MPAEKLDKLKPVSDGELVNTASVFISATNLFESVNQERQRETQRADYGEYIDYMLESNAPIPEKQMITTMS